MKIKKIELLTTVKGKQVWEIGEYIAPFPTDLQGLLTDFRVVKVLEYEKEPEKEPEKEVEEKLDREKEEEKTTTIIPEKEEDKTEKKIIGKVSLKKKGK